MKLVIVVTAALMFTSCSTSSPTDAALIVERPYWGPIFADAGMSGTIAVREIGSSTTQVWNERRVRERRLPASTFKILNSLIILETGVLPDVDTPIPWDGTTRPVPEWNQDHTLRSGIEVSAVWAFQELARQVGEERMSNLVERAEYGNADIGGGADAFWLRGDLRISPLEQLDFLERLEQRELLFRDEVMDTVSEILIREQGNNWAWLHKTGTAIATDPTLGWLVGITRNGNRSWVFAMNVDLAVVDDLATQVDPQVRQSISRQILTQIGALPS